VRLLLAAVAAGAAVPLAQAAATSLTTELETFQTDVRNYNVISFANSSFTNFGDTQGPLAIGGNLTLDGGTVAAQPGNFGVDGDPTLYVAGQLTLSGQTQLNSGYASTPALTGSWMWNASSKTLSDSSGSLNSTNAGTANAGNNPIDNPAPTNWNWSTETSQLTTVSNALANATANGTISVSSQNLVLTAPTNPSTGVDVFTLNANNISGNTYNGQTFSNVQINVPTGVNYVINVINAAGTTIFGSGVNVNSGTNDSQLLWNIEGSGTVTLGGGQFIGSVLAPSATINNGDSTVVSGQVVADSFNDNDAETHYQAFVVGSVVVPEPATFAWGALGLCGLALLVRRRCVS
jgi:choice-of-anchor A domain-containing protein